MQQKRQLCHESSFSLPAMMSANSLWCPVHKLIYTLMDMSHDPVGTPGSGQVPASSVPSSCDARPARLPDSPVVRTAGTDGPSMCWHPKTWLTTNHRTTRGVLVGQRACPTTMLSHLNGPFSSNCRITASCSCGKQAGA